MSHHDSFSSQYQGTPPAVLYYTCPWTVTPAAKSQLEASFTVEIDSLGLTARLSYDHDKHLFKIECLPKEKAMVYNMFAGVINAFLKEQVGPTVEKESTLATKIGPIPFGVRTEVKEVADDVLLKGFVKTEWSCQRIEQYGGVFDTKLLKKIGELTECTLTYNSEARMITVVGPAQEACHHAITKLDKVRDYEIPIFNNPYPNQKHLFYAEEHTDYAPVPTPLKRIHDLALYENTLLDISAYPPTSFSPYHSLSLSGILRCAIYDKNHRALRALPLPKKPEPAIKEAQRGGEFKVFAKHRFAGRRDVDPLVGVVEELEQMENGGEMEGEFAFERKAKIEVWVQGVEGDGTVPEDVVTEERGLISPVKEKVSESSRVAETTKVALERRMVAPVKQEVAEITGTTSNGKAKKQIRDVSKVRAAAATHDIPPHLRDLFSASVPAPAPAAGPVPKGTSLMDMDIEDSVSLTLQPLSLLPTALMAPIAPTSSINPTSDLPQPLADTSQLLIEPLTNTPQPLIETLQTTPEPTTRTYHHTMNLHAPRPLTSKGHWDGNTFIPATPPTLLTLAFIASLHDATGPLLHALRGWRGSASLQVKIGRICIMQEVLHLSDPDSRSGIVNGPRMAKWLEAERRAEISTLVTEEAGDMEVPVGMKLFGGDKGFWKKTPKWGVEYIFPCVDPRGDGEGGGEGGKFTVTVDAETFRWKCETGERCLGDTWVHCLKRVWDFKVCAAGRQEVGGEYAEWAAELVESLYIPADTDTTNLTLSFSLPAPHALSFPTIRVARKCTYASTTTPVLLHITEMHDLLVSRVGCSPSGQIVYRASARSGRGDSHQEARWFE
ncbi:hypothetical protein V498_06160, partial [Pseudogymnoascus sp. VKM F-4517 (FW-2822)]